MATFNNIGDTIEGNATKGQTRRLEFKCLKKHPDTNITMRLYSCDRNSSITVIESSPIPEEENIKDATKHYHRKDGDCLTADAISVYIDSKAKITHEVKEGVSGRHGASLFCTKHAIATVKTPLQNLLKKLGYTANKSIE